MKNDALKKHHFWILAGVGPFFALLAALLVWSNVGDEIQAKSGEIDKKLKDVKGTSPKGKIAIEQGYPKQKEEVLKKREQLWKVQWDKQRELFAWPKDPSGGLQQLEKQYVKFGTTIPNVDALESFTKKDVYEGAYDEIASVIRPTTFPGGNWRSVLRYVSNWPKRPDSKQVWLALEDLWVQQGLLMPVKAINDEAAKFELERPAGANGQPTEPPPLKRTFVSRVWKLELEVPTTGPKANKVLLARLTNRTGRLQVFGNGPRGHRNTMWLKIKLSENGPPIDYFIESATVKGGSVINITLDNANPLLQSIPTGTDIQKIIEVRQVLDEQTTPVRMVKNIELGWKDSRHSPATLTTMEFLKTPEVAADATGALGGASDLGGGMPAPGGLPGGPGGPMGGMPGMPGTGGAAAKRSKTGTPEIVLNANKDRYLQTTEQVRRMPVAVVLIVDQMFLQDALVAYANSPLRFQITQYHWGRFRGQLPTTSGSQSGGGGFFGGGELMAGSPPGGPGGESEMPPDETGGYVLPGSGYPGGSMPGGPPAPEGGPTGYPGGPMAGGFGGYTPGGYGSGMFGGSTTTAQTTSGLVELSIYGIVTMYEKYEEKPAEGTATNGTTPAETTPPVTTTPVPGAPAPTQPMTPTATTPPAPAPAVGSPMPQPGAAPAAPPGPATPPAAPQPKK
jgi:hypothetical protein